jgi:hypothetical protein
MTKFAFFLSLAVALGTVVPAHGAAQDHSGHSAHVGKEDREIKAYSDEEVRALLEGEGAGYALPAELNQYPGPLHVLELKDALALTGEQEREVQAIFRAMNTRARELGARLVEEERELDRAFGERTITPERLRELTRSIAALEAELRAEHLEAHLRTTDLLTLHQIHTYDAARGYAGGGAHGH